jgi:ribonuclease P protein component
LGLSTLKNRADFLRLRGGARWATAAFVLETKPRPASQLASVEAGPRFGFTVTKAMGSAVVRNRIRRRLKGAVLALVCSARADNDYVLIARAAALDRPFSELKKDLEQAFQRVHHPAGRGRGTKA